MKNTVVTFKQAKENNEKLTMLTAYDYSTAKLMDEAGVNAILVGDSLGNVMLGSSTLEVARYRYALAPTLGCRLALVRGYRGSECGIGYGYYAHGTYRQYDRITVRYHRHSYDCIYYGRYLACSRDCKEVSEWPCKL